MMTEDDANEFAEKLAGATERTVRDYEKGDVVHEEPFSNQLCGRLKETLEDFETASIHWQVEVTDRKSGIGRLQARTLTTTKEEPDLGADLIVALDIATPEYSVRKGFLAQSKRLERGNALNKTEREKLLSQCERMINVTAASMVFLYSTEGVHVIPAAAVIANQAQDLWSIETYNIFILYRDFAICWFGDLKIQATDPASLEGLRALVGADAAIRFIGKAR